VQVLRSSNKKLKKQLDDLIHIARDNDKLGRQINKMVLKIMPAEDISGLIATIQESLLRDFSADAVEIRLTITPKDAKLAERVEFVKDVPAMRRLFEKFLKDMRPMCGRLKQAQREYIFEAQAQKVASVALLPVTLGSKCIGLLAIGSHDEQRFRAGMGTAYLGHMSAFISKTLERILGK
jgi:uncharacterized protein YigA (DUF484 family)